MAAPASLVVALLSSEMFDAATTDRESTRTRGSVQMAHARLCLSSTESQYTIHRTTIHHTHVNKYTYSTRTRTPSLLVVWREFNEQRAQCSMCNAQRPFSRTPRAPLAPLASRAPGSYSNYEYE